MVQRKHKFDPGNLEKSVFEQLLDIWGLNYTSFAELIAISYNTLLQYRKGLRTAKFDTEQIQEIEKLLSRIGLKFKDLPTDWILDKHPPSSEVSDRAGTYIAEVDLNENV